jgi:hypothetical protein
VGVVLTPEDLASADIALRCLEGIAGRGSEVMHDEVRLAAARIRRALHDEAVALATSGAHRTLLTVM